MRTAAGIKVSSAPCFTFMRYPCNFLYFSSSFGITRKESEWNIWSLIPICCGNSLKTVSQDSLLQQSRGFPPEPSQKQDAVKKSLTVCLKKLPRFLAAARRNSGSLFQKYSAANAPGRKSPAYAILWASFEILRWFILSIGLANDMYAESGNDSYQYRELAGQKDFDQSYFAFL